MNQSSKRDQYWSFWCQNQNQEVFEDKGLLRSSRPLRFLRLPGKSLISSLVNHVRSLDVIIQFQTSFHFDVKKRIVGRITKYQAKFWHPFLLEAVKTSQCYFSENGLKRLVCPNLLNVLLPSFKLESQLQLDIWDFKVYQTNRV